VQHSKHATAESEAAHVSAKPLKDFRSARAKLPPEVFAISEGMDAPASDLVPKDTWDSIVHLPDDVSLRTSDHYGSCLKDLWDLWGDWVTLVLELQGRDQELAETPIARVALDSASYFQASVYNALVGYYRLAFASLRGVIENMTIGLYFELTPDLPKFRAWLAGDEFGFGSAADQLRQRFEVTRLEQQLQAAVGDDLFRQRNVTGRADGGLIREVFRELSKYAHGGPNYSDADLWASNGPVFVHGVLEQWVRMYALVFAIGLLEIRIGRPDLLPRRKDRRELAELLRCAIALLIAGSEERRILEAAAAIVWPQS
jgi:hypothetical protein